MISLFLKGFFVGMGSVLSFGKTFVATYPITSVKKSVERDWEQVGSDVRCALNKYKKKKY